MIKTICNCDRCGKKIALDGSYIISFNYRKSTIHPQKLKHGEVCEECYEDFIELAESFFDELNKGEQA